MTDEEIEKLAIKHEAFGFGLADRRATSTHGFDPDGIIAFAREVEATEREACAKLIDSHPQAQLATQYDWTRRIGQDLSAAILARSNAISTAKPAE